MAATLLRLKDQFDSRVDVLIGIRGLPTESFERAIEVPFSGERLKVVSSEDFIVRGRPQHLVDAWQVLTINAAKLDLQSLRQITAHYGREAVATLKALTDG
jgi:hypothetical protein